MSALPAAIAVILCFKAQSFYSQPLHLKSIKNRISERKTNRFGKDRSRVLLLRSEAIDGLGRSRKAERRSSTRIGVGGETGRSLRAVV